MLRYSEASGLSVQIGQMLRSTSAQLSMANPHSSKRIKLWTVPPCLACSLWQIIFGLSRRCAMILSDVVENFAKREEAGRLVCVARPEPVEAARPALLEVTCPFEGPEFRVWCFIHRSNRAVFALACPAIPPQLCKSPDYRSFRASHKRCGLQTLHSFTSQKKSPFSATPWDGPGKARSNRAGGGRPFTIRLTARSCRKKKG